jgi:hypothetical protein
MEPKGFDEKVFHSMQHHNLFRRVLAFFLCSYMAMASAVEVARPRAVFICVETPQEATHRYKTIIETVTTAYDVSILRAGELPETAVDADLIVLPDAAAIPGPIVADIESLLRTGADLIALQTPIAKHAKVEYHGEWITRQRYQQRTAMEPPPHVAIQFDPATLDEWFIASERQDHQSTHEIVADVPGPGQCAYHAIIPDYQKWDVRVSPKLDNPFPPDHTQTVFSAKGGPRTTELSVEWTERDGSRWIAVVPLTTEWRRYVLSPEDFRYWASVEERMNSSFNPAQADQFRVGLSFTHTGRVWGEHEYWIGPIGTAPPDKVYGQFLSDAALPKLDTLCPSFKLFESHDVATLAVRDDQAILSGHDSLPLPGEETILSPHPRPRGAGFDKGRSWRWAPLLEARSANDQWRGTPATMLVHRDGPYRGGAWFSFGIQNDEWYSKPAAVGLIEQVVRRLQRPIWLLDGGTHHYTYFADHSIKAGAHVMNLHASTVKVDVHLHLLSHDGEDTIEQHKRSLAVPPGAIEAVTCDWLIPTPHCSEGWRCRVELLHDGRVIDRLQHEVHVALPDSVSEFVTVDDAQFRLNGERWRPHGINYMPSSGIAYDDYDYFEYWTSAESYDPEVIERDLAHIREIGYNAVSVFTYAHTTPAGNLLDLLRQIEVQGLKANLSLRPGTPMEFHWDEIRDIIETYRLADNDTVFAYDLAWEPNFGTQTYRQRWDDEWVEWVTERYGSIENAEADWQHTIPRDEAGAITNPTREMIDNAGPWWRMVAAYRRFLNTHAYECYNEARRLVHTVDPNHLVSFRMWEAGNPTYKTDHRISYDFRYIAHATDFLAPEAYGRIGDWEKVKPGWFTRVYAGWAAPDKPMIWSEMGDTVWSRGHRASIADLLNWQAEYYDRFYRMMTLSGAEGVFSWWYAGGFRANEDSDYGIVNPDKTDRPVTKVIREWAPRFLEAPSPGPIDEHLTFDIDPYPIGLAGAYDEVKDAFWSVIGEGKTPGLRTIGTGTTSKNCPLIAVGNTEYNGSNPPKFLDGAFDYVEVRGLDGQWQSVADGDHVEVDGSNPIEMRVWITNVNEATWIAASGDPKLPENEGAVYIRRESPIGPSPSSSRQSLSWRSLSQDVTPGESLGPVVVPVDWKDSAHSLACTFCFEAAGRSVFGERFRLTFVPHQEAKSD